VGGVDGSVYEGMDGFACIAGGMQYHRVRIAGLAINPVRLLDIARKPLGVFASLDRF
jgi:hypothetical protein